MIDVSVKKVQWHMKKPFVTATESTTSIEVLLITLTNNGINGRAETLGVDYLGESADTIKRQIEEHRGEFTRGITHKSLQTLLPPGGARNGIDCALWDLEAKKQNTRAWEIIGLSMKPVETLYTLPCDTSDEMAKIAQKCRWAKKLKLKLDSNDVAGKLFSVRNARPDADLIIDANTSWSPTLLDKIADVLASAKVELLEQPLPTTDDSFLKDLNYPIPICADESFQSSADLDRILDHYDAFNIKLDKCGGLTDALTIVDRCKKNKKKILVGNMLGSSLAMAPALIIAQHSDWVDLDGPLLQKEDISPAIRFEKTKMHPPDIELWG